MDHEIVLTPALGNASYLLASDGEAVAVDPPRDAWRIIAAADARGWRITRVVETHVHNDYLSGALELRAALKAEILAPARGRYAFAHRGVDDGDELVVGGLRLTARATPGHTPEHLAWEVTQDGESGPSAVLTGGSLLVGSAGRTDLLGAEQTDALTRAQFHTLRSLAALPDEVAVMPTHGSGSFCSAGPVDGSRTSTIGTERWHNPLFRVTDEAAFRTAALDRLGPFPTYYREMAPINRAGPAILVHAPTLARLDPAGVRAATAAGAHVVDGRPRATFAAGHIPGALNIELDDSFASYVGWFVPFGEPVVLVLPEPLDESGPEASVQLLRIGYDRVAGVLSGGVPAWVDAGGSVRSYPVVGTEAVRGELARGEHPTLLDVRDPLELRDDGAVEGAITVPVGELPGKLGVLPHDGAITVMCRSGQRASVAASVLHAAGFDVRLVGSGGAPEIARPGGPAPGP
jgi:glyoxylase-like metal-dependent hydrolase (beta-lactamase superfamily II)/rhodanese-related sulfurtransferase